jgi:hypothetical protein
MSLPSISQTATSDSLVCIPPRVAKQIVTDLKHYDLLKVENDTLKSNIVDYQTIIEKQKDIIIIKDSLITTLDSTAVNLTLKTATKDVIIEEKNTAIKKLKKQRNIAGGSAIGLFLIVLALL